MFKRFLNLESKSINTAAIILAVSALVSGLLGLFRDRLLAGSFGAGNELDIYYTAFRIPDFISTILIIGSISAAVIPLFSEYLAKSEKDAWKFFGNLLNSFLLFMAIISAVVIIFVPQILHLIAPGFSGDKLAKTVDLTRIMFLSPILLGISNMVSSVLRIFKRFVISSLSPIMYNIGIIIGVLLFVPFWGLEGLAWGVVLGAFLHFIIQIPMLFNLGFKIEKEMDLSHPGVARTIKLTLPRTLGLAANQINLIVITAIGSTLSAGSIAIFNLANNLQSLPIAFIANSLSTAAFPFLALYHSQKNREKFIEEFSAVFRQTLFYLVPASLLIFILRAQIIRILYGTGRFSWGDTQITAACLGLFSIGIFAYGLSILISKVFYALHNTKIPALIAFLSIIINIILSFFFLWILNFSNFFSDFILSLLDIKNIGGNGVIGLSLALSISGIIQLALLLYLLYKKVGDIRIKEIFYFSVKVILAGIVLAIISLLVRDIFSKFVDMQRFWGIFWQTAVSSLAGIFAYSLIAFFLGLPEINLIKQFLFKKPPQNY